jgi:ATP-dependent RNA helicase DeaD
VDAGEVISLINRYTLGSRINIGKIDIMKKFSFFEVENQSEKEILDAFRKADYKGTSIKVERSIPDTKSNVQKDAAPFRKRKKKKGYPKR